jgi:rubrerythrin
MPALNREYRACETRGARRDDTAAPYEDQRRRVIPPYDHTFNPRGRHMNQAQVKELLIQSLEHEHGGIQVYETALKCVQNEGLQEEWEKYLEQTRNHERILLQVFAQLSIDPEEASPGRKVVNHLGKALVKAMEMALQAGEPAAAELVAGECVVLAETKDHANWELISKCAQKGTGQQAKVLKQAAEEVEEEEDEHLYHSKGWCRELWLQSLGMKAVLPPPEERKHVTSAIGAARAEQASEHNR